MNNEARVSPARRFRRSVNGNCGQRAPAYDSRMTVVTITGTTTIKTTTTITTTERRYEIYGSGVRRRPRLLKVRDGSVAETLPSFAFNPDPHFVGAWSILHLPPFPVAVVLFRSYLLGLVNLENGRHIVSPSRPRFPRVSLSLFPLRGFFLSLQPSSYATVPHGVFLLPFG